MIEPKNEKEARELMQKVIAKQLPSIFRNMSNIRDGIIRNIDLVSRTAQIEINGTGGIINAKYIAATDSPQIGAVCLVLSTDPSLTRRCFALIF